MLVGQSPLGIILSKNIYLDKYSDKILVLGNNKKNYKHFILPNISNQNNRFILVDSVNNFECLNNTIICDFNSKQTQYNPFDLIENEADISAVTGYILSSFKFKTKIDPVKFSKGLSDYLFSVIAFVYHFNRDNLNIKTINNLLKKANDPIENLDIIFSKQFEKEIIAKTCFKKYFNFKTLPTALQREIITQLNTIFDKIINNEIFKENNTKIDNLTEFLNSNKNLVIIPNNSKKIMIKPDELLLMQILAKKKEKDAKELQYKLLSDTTLGKLLSNAMLFETTQQINNNSNIQLIINTPGETRINQLLSKLLFSTFPSLSISFIENNINNFKRKTKQINNPMLLINNIVYYGTNDLETMTLLNTITKNTTKEDFESKELNNKAYILQLNLQNNTDNIFYEHVLDTPVEAMEKEENIKKIEFNRNFKNNHVKNNKNIETWGLPNNYL